jgi:hypothetical protein
MGFSVCIYGLKKTQNENGEQEYEHLYDFNQSYNSFDQIKNELKENLNDSFEEDLFEVLGDLWNIPFHQPYISNPDQYCSLLRIQKILDRNNISYDELSDEFKEKFNMILCLFDYDSDEYADIFMFAM